MAVPEQHFDELRLAERGGRSSPDSVDSFEQEHMVAFWWVSRRHYLPPRIWCKAASE